MTGRNYIVYFDIFGKKMKTTIWATSLESAKEMIRQKITFDKIEVQPPTPPKPSGNSIFDIEDFKKACGL